MATGHPYYRVVPTSDKKWRAHFYGGNDKLVWFSQSYQLRTDAVDAIRFNRAYAASGPLKP